MAHKASNINNKNRQQQFIGRINLGELSQFSWVAEGGSSQSMRVVKISFTGNL